MAKSALWMQLWVCYNRTRPRDARLDSEREALIVGQLPIVRRIAREQHRIFRHADIQDLEQVGCLGLLEAADRWCPQAGEFAPFAYFRIRGAIVDSQKRREIKYAFASMSLEAMADHRDGWLPPALDTCPDPLPDEIFGREQVLAKLAAAVESLPPTDLALLRAWMQSLPIREQCQISGMSPNSTRSRVAEIVAQVRALVTAPDIRRTVAELPRPRLAVPLRACA